MANGNFLDIPGHFDEEPEQEQLTLDEELKNLQQLLEEDSEIPVFVPDSDPETIPPLSDVEPESVQMPKTRKPLWIVVGILALVLLIGIAALVWVRASDPYDCKILDNVTIAGVNVGGMTRFEAKSAVREAAGNSYAETDMVIQLPDTTLTLSPADTGAKLDISAAVKAAYSYGRTGSEAEREEAFRNSLSSTYTVDLAACLGLDTAYIQSVLDAYSNQFSGTYIPTTWELQGELPELAEDKMDESAPGQTLVIHVGTPGLALDMKALYQDILDAYNANVFLVTSDAPSAEATPEDPDLDAVHGEISHAAVDAAINEETFSAIPGTYGYSFDTAFAQELLDKADYGDTVEIPMEYIKPEIHVDNVFFQDVLGTCDTKHNDNENRNTNLRLVCEILDGMILQPGEEFSFNGVVGERTKERGFMPAPAYSGDTLVNSYGGGVCQTSSTLYNCALLADLEIVTRLSHGYTVSYLPIGLDATVNWGTTDFAFRNSLNYPIMLKAEVSDGYVRMQILGTDDKDYYIKMESTSSPGGGYIYATSYRCKYNKETDELISRELEARSIYRD